MAYVPDNRANNPWTIPFDWHNEELDHTTPMTSSNLKSRENSLTDYAVAQVTKAYNDLNGRLTTVEGVSATPSIVAVNNIATYTFNTGAGGNLQYSAVYEVNSAANTNLRIDAVTTGFDRGGSVTVVRKGTGTVTFTNPGGFATITSPFDFFVITPQLGQVTLYKTDPNSWIIGGYLGT